MVQVVGCIVGVDGGGGRVHSGRSTRHGGHLPSAQALEDHAFPCEQGNA